MDPILYLPIWIAIFLPLISVWASNQHLSRIRQIKRKQRKEGIKMNNELVSEYVGKNVSLNGNGMLGVTGIVTKVVDNWLELEYKSKKKLINIDYISSIEEIPQKK